MQERPPLALKGVFGQFNKGQGKFASCNRLDQIEEEEAVLGAVAGAATAETTTEEHAPLRVPIYGFVKLKYNRKIERKTRRTGMNEKVK